MLKVYFSIFTLTEVYTVLSANVTMVSVHRVKSNLYLRVTDLFCFMQIVFFLCS